MDWCDLCFVFNFPLMNVRSWRGGRGFSLLYSPIRRLRALPGVCGGRVIDVLSAPSRGTILLRQPATTREGKLRGKLTGRSENIRIFAFSALGSILGTLKVLFWPFLLFRGCNAFGSTSLLGEQRVFGLQGYGALFGHLGVWQRGGPGRVGRSFFLFSFYGPLVARCKPSDQACPKKI